MSQSSHTPPVDSKGAGLTVEEQLAKLYKGTLICPFKDCYEKDRVRYMNASVLHDHFRFDHVTYMDIKREPVALIPAPRKANK